jgi:hypothetical protein
MKKLQGILIGLALTLSVTGFSVVYNYFAPGGALSGTATSQNVNLSAGSPFIAGNLPFANLQTMPNNSAYANVSGSVGTGAAINPLALANMLSAVLAVDAATTGNITLSGAQTIDGQSIGSGQTVLVKQQTTQANNGIYISSAGAWTRAANFPAGYVIAQNCDLAIFVRNGNVNGGVTFSLQTVSTVTIGTTNQVWAEDILAPASTSAFGTVKITANGSSIVPSITGFPAAASDCASFGDLAGSIADNGNNQTATGPCIVADVNGHPVLEGTGTAPTVTGTGCSLNAGGTDNRGSITASGADTCTLTYGSGFFAGSGSARAPFCSTAPVGATLGVSLSSAPTTAHAIFVTTLAGTFDYVCL